MRREELIELITQEVCKALGQSDQLNVNKNTEKKTTEYSNEDEEIFEVMKRHTTARVCEGKAGARLRTKTMLKLRADHAKAKDAVNKDVDDELLKKMNLFSVSSKCRDREEHLTRPDIGRQLDKEVEDMIKKNCINKPTVQIYVSDGLSSSAINENIKDMLPVLVDGLKMKNIKVGTPFFVKYGRVPTMDRISEILDAEVTCVLIGERPGLIAADSMSAYIVYKAYVGMPESRRTVISNIHSNGIQPVEAGAYAAEVISKMLDAKQSGVDLKL